MRPRRSPVPVLLLALALAAGAWSGCRAEFGTNPLDPAGTWDLRTADGLPLPARVVDEFINDPGGGFVLEIIAEDGFVALEPNGRYELRIRFQPLVNGTPDLPYELFDHGDWYEDAGEIVFESDFVAPREYVAVYGGRSLTFVEDFAGEGIPVEYVFRR